MIKKFKIFEEIDYIENYGPKIGDYILINSKLFPSSKDYNFFLSNNIG